MADGKQSKARLEVEIDADLAAQAAADGIDLSATLEAALRQKSPADRQIEWRRLNRPAVEAWNRLVEHDGIWADKYRD